MRIGIFDPYLDDIGGGEKYMMSIAECLSRSHQVVVFWDKKEDLEKIHERFSIDLSRCAIRENIFAKSYGFFKRIFETLRYDAIIFLSDGSIPFVLSKKLYLHIQQPLATGINKNLFKFKIKLARVNKIIFNSNYSQSFVDSRIAERGIVLYPPVHLYPKRVKKENIILHVGRFRVKNVGIGDYKKQDVMIKALKKMVDNGLLDWCFILAVSVNKKDEEEFNKMKEDTKGYPIEFLVNETNKDLWNVYSRARIYWHASGFGEDLAKYPERAEHFGISTVEAMGAGAVPVVINAGGQKEIVKNGKSGFLWNTTEELIDRTQALINSKELLETMSEEALKRSKKFSGDRFCKELESIIFKVF